MSKKILGFALAICLITGIAVTSTGNQWGKSAVAAESEPMATVGNYSSPLDIIINTTPGDEGAWKEIEYEEYRGTEEYPYFYTLNQNEYSMTVSENEEIVIDTAKGYEDDSNVLQWYRESGYNGLQMVEVESFDNIEKYLDRYETSDSSDLDGVEWTYNYPLSEVNWKNMGYSETGAEKINIGTLSAGKYLLTVEMKYRVDINGTMHEVEYILAIYYITVVEGNYIPSTQENPQPTDMEEYPDYDYNSFKQNEYGMSVTENDEIVINMADGYEDECAEVQWYRDNDWHSVEILEVDSFEDIDSYHLIKSDGEWIYGDGAWDYSYDPDRESWEGVAYSEHGATTVNIGTLKEGKYIVIVTAGLNSQIGRIVAKHDITVTKGSGMSVRALTNGHVGTFFGFVATFDKMPESAFLQFDSPADNWTWFGDDYCSQNPVFNIPTDEIVEEDGKYVYRTSFMIYSSGNPNDGFKRNVRVAASFDRSTQYSSSTSFTANPLPEFPKNTIGNFYEQTNEIPKGIMTPEILNVEKERRGDVYILTVTDYIVQNEDWAFFYWHTTDGGLEGVTDDFKSVSLAVSGSATVTVTMGDGYGYIAQKTIEI